VAREAALLIGRKSSNPIGGFRSTFLSRKVLPRVSIEMHGKEIIDTNITLKTSQ